ncbi:hypothetical protein I4U23_006130 [Adineta vaga]|nr:hypothetical protein I4U23_006130 [Adineta vaga]
MVEHLLSIKTNELNNIEDGTNRLSKSVSFNTDDDDSVQPGDSQHISDNEGSAAQSNTISLAADKLKRGLFSIHSPSIDSINDPEGLNSDIPLSEKIKKKKQRRLTHQSSVDSGKKVVVKSQPWYTKVDLIKPLIYVGLVIILYFMWTQRAVWIPRLLTSNSRIRHIALANEEKLQEKGYSPQNTASDNSNSTNSNQDDDDDDDDDNNNDSNNSRDQTSVTNNDENSPTTSNKYTTPQKLNIRVRRNKMSFSNKDRPDKKRRLVQRSIIDDDDEDDVIEDNGIIETDSDEVVIKDKISGLPSSIHSSKRHHHHHHQQQQQSKANGSRGKNRRTVLSSQTGLATTSQHDLIVQLQRLIGSHERSRNLLSVISKETGLKKDKIKQFIEKKNFRVISLDNFISIINSYNSSLLIIPN